MSKEALEKLRTKFAADREATFRQKLAELVRELEVAKQADDFIIESLA